MMGMDMSNVSAPYATMMANMMTNPYMNQFMGPLMQSGWNASLPGKNMMWMNDQKVSSVYDLSICVAIFHFLHCWKSTHKDLAGKG